MARQSRAPTRPPTILLTRPAEQSARFAAQLRVELPGAQVIESALLVPEFLSPPVDGSSHAALVLTSETAVEAARRIVAESRSLPRLAFCVGDRTAEVARAAGFHALSAAGDARDLMALLRAQAPKGRLLYLRGQEVAADLVTDLSALGILADSAIVYAQKPQPLSPEAIDALGRTGVVIVPVFSPRSARVLAAALPPGRKAALHVAAISPNAAAAAQALAPDQLVIADHPDAPAMLRAVVALHVAAALP